MRRLGTTWSSREAAVSGLRRLNFGDPEIIPDSWLTTVNGTFDKSSRSIKLKTLTKNASLNKIKMLKGIQPGEFGQSSNSCLASCLAAEYLQYCPPACGTAMTTFDTTLGLT